MFKQKNVDYYSGFQGEPEIIFKIQRQQKTFEFKIWTGYFNSILCNVHTPPERNNNFLSLYNLQEGWYDNSPFEIKDVEEVIDTFNQFKVSELSPCEKMKINSFIPVLEEIKEELVSFLEFAKTNKYNVMIIYD